MYYLITTISWPQPATLFEAKMDTRIDASTIDDRASLLFHRKIAAVVDGAPELVESARRRIGQIIAATVRSTEGDRLWQKLLCQPWTEARERMLGDGHIGRLLRYKTPFAAVVGAMDEDERHRVWEQAKAELEVELAAAPNEFMERQVWIREFVHAGKAARDHLAAGRSIAVRHADTPPGYIVMVHPDGSEEQLESDEAVRRSRYEVSEFLDQKERAKQKAESRDRDARDVADGSATVEDVLRRNSFIPADIAREAVITNWGNWGQNGKDGGKEW
ncbi:MAG: hypothetical protein ACOYLS_09385 [Polymorphobacter sp.]